MCHVDCAPEHLAWLGQPFLDKKWVKLVRELIYDDFKLQGSCWVKTNLQNFDRNGSKIARNGIWIEIWNRCFATNDLQPICFAVAAQKSKLGEIRVTWSDPNCFAVTNLHTLAHTHTRTHTLVHTHLLNPSQQHTHSHPALTQPHTHLNTHSPFNFQSQSFSRS